MSWNFGNDDIDATALIRPGSRNRHQDAEHPRKETKAGTAAQRAATFATFPRIATEEPAGDWARGHSV